MRIPKGSRPVTVAEVSPDATLDHLAAAVASRQGGAFEVTVAHDDDCPRLRGGECRCEPEIRVGSPESRGRN